MNSTHAVTGGAVAMLASLLVYLTHWPIQPLTTEEALNVAGLLAMAAPAIMYLFNKPKA
jgi:hypothetical protein